MNIIDYALRLGKLLRKTPEGQDLLNKQYAIEEKYKGNQEFGEFERYIEKQASRFYFYSWDLACKTFLHVLEDTNIEHRDIFLNTAELVKEDTEIRQLADTALTFGNIFESIVRVILLGDDIKGVMRPNWKYKIKNGIANVQVGVERSKFFKEVLEYAQTHRDEFESEGANEYYDRREKSGVPPFSNMSKDLMNQYPQISDAHKRVIEDMNLIMDIVKRGIYYGFWEMLAVISEEDLIECEGLEDNVLKEMTFTHKNFETAVRNKSWLYRIDLKEYSVYFLANNKVLHWEPNNQYCEVSGVVYPVQDKDFFGERMV